MDESAFLKNERANEYEAVFRVSGEYRVTVTADSQEDARRQAEAILAAKDIELVPEDIEQADLSRVFKLPPMYLVTRDGKIMQSTRLTEGDQPRQPTEHGF